MHPEFLKEFTKEFSSYNITIIKELPLSSTGDGVHKELRGKKQISDHSKAMLAVVKIFSVLPKILVNTSHVSWAMCMYRGSVNNVTQYWRGKFLQFFLDNAK